MAIDPFYPSTLAFYFLHGCSDWLGLFGVRFPLRMILKDTPGTAQQKARDDD
jgi:hypothetical protein